MNLSPKQLKHRATARVNILESTLKFSHTCWPESKQRRSLSARILTRNTTPKACVTTAIICTAVKPRRSYARIRTVRFTREVSVTHATTALCTPTRRSISSHSRCQWRAKMTWMSSFWRNLALRCLWSNPQINSNSPNAAIQMKSIKTTPTSKSLENFSKLRRFLSRIVWSYDTFRASKENKSSRINSRCSSLCPLKISWKSHRNQTPLSKKYEYFLIAWII